MGPAPLDAREEPRVERPCAVLHAAARDRDAGGFERGKAAAGNAGIGIFERHDRARDPGPHQRVGAGAGLALMGAGLQGHVAGGALRAGAGAGQRLGLGVGPAAGLGPAAAGDPAVADEHAADRRVGPDAAEAAPGERQRQRHEAAVEGRVGRRIGRGHGVHFRSSASPSMNSSKSFFSPKFR